MKEDVFFETIGNGHRPLVMWYLARGHRVSVFNFTYALKSMPWVRKLINEERISRLEANHLPGVVDPALEATEWLYSKLSGDKLVRHLCDIFGEDEAEAVFKHGLVLDISQYISLRLYLQKHIERARPNYSAILVPDSFGYWDRLLNNWCSERLGPLEGVRTPGWVRAWSGLIALEKRALKSIRYNISNSISLLAMSLGRRLGRPDKAGDVREYKHIFALDAWPQVRFEGPRRFDFLLDNERLTRENTAFLVSHNIERRWVEEAGRAGYTVIYRSQFGDDRHPGRYLRTPPHRIDLWPAAKAVAQGALRPMCPAWLSQTAALGVSTYVNEANILERLRYVNYVYMAQDGIRQRWRNAMIRRAGRQSWNFAYSIGGGYLLENGGGRERLHRLWTYQNPDNYVTQSPQMIDYHKKHHQKVRSYHEVGNIWSELVRVESETAYSDEALHRWLGGYPKGMKAIAWFDTSVAEAENSDCTYNEATLWYTYVQRLLEENENLLFVIKPSKAESYFTDPKAEWSHPLGAALMEKWNELKQHPRVYFAGSRGDPVSVIALCDLTVTYCFSSCTAEALGAGKRAIWSEPGDRWRNTLYGPDPMLTAHGYGELSALVRKLLYDVSDEEYERFLQERIRGLVEPFLDGKGLSRFRELLHSAVQCSPEAELAGGRRILERIGEI